ncbi:MAG TPA: DUF885 domain-containing protein [Burkholderiales bacterium]|nr:DUF885 domain-containing protein [Burkholderiales bacterium]
MTDIASSFDDLVKHYYRSWFRYHPEAAVDAGVPGYAHLLSPCGEEEKGALVCLNDELRVELEEIDIDSLDADRRIDYQILCGATQLENQQLLDVEPLHPDPGRFLPVDAIYQLTFRLVDDFDAAMEARLAAIPVHLNAAQLRVSAKAQYVPPLWARSAITAARGGTEFLAGLTAHPKITASPKRDSILAHLQQAGTALGRYAEFIENVVLPAAKGSFACGPERFNELLRQRHFLDVDADALHAFGRRLFEETKKELEAACEAAFGHRDSARAVHQIQAANPVKGDLLAVYTEAMTAAREFVKAQGLVTVPAPEQLKVIDTPVFLRHQIPFAAYCDPAPNDPEQVGYYYVTPPADDEQRAEHDAIGLAHTSVHEAYPGHHLHFVTVNRTPAARSWPRLMNSSATCYEGWALYCEQLMQEKNFLARPESRIFLLRDRLWRALRICIDVELHTRGLTLDAAADRMVEALGFPRAHAIADITWYTQSPTVPMGYATGWALINALRRRENGSAALQSFHDRLLSAGAIALPLGIRRAFGDDAWNAIKTEVLG